MVTVFITVQTKNTPISTQFIPKNAKEINPYLCGGVHKYG